MVSQKKLEKAEGNYHKEGMVSLNLCCGTDIRKGYLNADLNKPYDICIDINDLPLPFTDNTFDEILFLSGLVYSSKPYKLIQEIHRILKPGGRLILRMMHYNNELTHRDLDLKTFGCSIDSFDMFDINKEAQWNHYHERFFIEKHIIDILPFHIPDRLSNLISMYIPNFGLCFYFHMTKLIEVENAGLPGRKQ